MSDNAYHIGLVVCVVAIFATLLWLVDTVGRGH